jgi:hypothetical protein
MVSKPMKRFSMSYVRKEIQIKTILRQNYTPIRIVKTRTLTTSNSGNNLKKHTLSFIAGWNTKWYSHFGRQIGNFLQNETY